MRNVTFRKSFSIVDRINHNGTTVKAFFQKHKESQTHEGEGKDYGTLFPTSESQPGEINVVNAFGLPSGLIILIYDPGPDAFKEVRMSYNKLHGPKVRLVDLLHGEMLIVAQQRERQGQRCGRPF